MVAKRCKIAPGHCSHRDEHTPTCSSANDVTDALARRNEATYAMHAAGVTRRPS